MGEDGFIPFLTPPQNGLTSYSSLVNLQSTARLHLLLIATQLPSSQVNLFGKHVVNVRVLLAPKVKYLLLFLTLFFAG